MSTERILEKIRQEAEREAAEIHDAAQKKAEAAADALLAAAQEQVAEIDRAAQEEAEEIRRRGALVAGLEARKNALRSKREVLDEAFALALDELRSLPADRYEALITKLVTQAAETGTETLIVSEQDAVRFQNGLMYKLNTELALLGKQGKLTLSPTGANIQGGVIVAGERADVNASFDALIRAARESCEREAAQILFGSEVG